MCARSRREFLADVGRGMLVAGLGSAAAVELGLARVRAAEPEARLTFGALEPLVAMLQESSPDDVLPRAVERLRQGTSLESLVSAVALANARAFGGHDYTGYHTFMALLPAYQMAGELPTERRALPVLKVIHRNSRRIHDNSAHDHDALPVSPPAAAGAVTDAALQASIRARDVQLAESQLAALCEQSPAEAFDALQPAIEDEVNVHRVVLAWRAWAMLDLAGPAQADAFLRQSVRFCIDSENYLHEKNRPASAVREVLPRLLEQYRLLDGPQGTRAGDDGWLDELARTIYAAAPADAAGAAAEALAAGFAPESVGEAISLAANLLLLHDPGRKAEWATPEKPTGCVHGDSVGVHAADAANAWRAIARVSNPRNRSASLVVAAYHTAGQSSQPSREPYPHAARLADVASTDPRQMLADARAAIEAGDQSLACAIVQRYGEGDHNARPLQDLLLQYAISEDGALHAEKYYRTATEEFAAMRPAFRWRQMVSLARVTASEFGHPAPGYQSARELLGLA